MLSGRHGQARLRVLDHCPEDLQGGALAKHLDFSVSGPWSHCGEANAKSLD